MAIGVDMHLHAETSECMKSIQLVKIKIFLFHLYKHDTHTIHRNATNLQFIPVPYNAPSFTGSDDGSRSSSLPSPFRFGSLSYTTAYVISITLTVCNSKGFYLFFLLR